MALRNSLNEHIKKQKLTIKEFAENCQMPLVDIEILIRSPNPLLEHAFIVSEVLGEHIENIWTNEYDSEEIVKITRRLLRPQDIVTDADNNDDDNF